MYPSEEKPYAGVFVKAQYEFMKNELEGEHKVDVFYMRYKPTNVLLSLLKYLMAYVRFIPKLFRNYDVVHVHYLGILSPVAILYRIFHPKTKTFVTCHGSDINKDLPAFGWKNGFFRYFIRKFNGIIAVGEPLHEPMWDKLGVKPHITLCAGIDKKLFYREVEAHKKYDFLVVGSFVPVKGLDVLKEAVESLEKNKYKFCFVGNGPEEALVHDIGKHADIEIKGSLTQDELRKVYNESKFLVFPSKNDAFGLVVTESIYCGTPALVNSTGGAQPQVVHGINGFIYEEHDPIELSTLLTSVMEMPKESYNQLSERCISSNYQYSLVHVCKTLADAYEDAHFNYRSTFNSAIA